MIHCCPFFLSRPLPVWEEVHGDVTESGGGFGFVCVCVYGVWMGGGVVRILQRMSFGVTAHAPLNEHMSMSVV